jgi:hypothetical protein
MFVIADYKQYVTYNLHLYSQNVLINVHIHRPNGPLVFAVKLKGRLI